MMNQAIPPSTTAMNRLTGEHLSPWSTLGIGLLVIAALTLLMFLDTMVSTTHVLSAPGTDTYSQYVYWRQFGFDELSSGNLALWNPYVAGGLPFLGGFQAALLYPPNWLHMLLPLATAINVIIALHVFLLGVFTFLWVRHRSMGLLPGLLAAVMLMFGGPHFLHIYSGHLSNLCAMPWVVLVLLCIDGVFDRRSLGWSLAGMGAVAMLILAGHPQYTFYAAVACGIYTLLQLIKAQQRLRVIGLLALMGLGAVLLTAVQLWVGQDAVGESVRSLGVQFKFAAMFSFPPENVLTLLTPNIFGGLGETVGASRYWGRCYLWEMSLFVSATGLVLAVFGTFAGEDRFVRHSHWVVLALFVLALGVHTPLFRLLYDLVPGFDKFRGNSKFTWPLIVFVAMLGAVGLHQLLRMPAQAFKLGVIVAALAVVLAVTAISIQTTTPSGQQTGGWWHEVMKTIRDTEESYIHPLAFNDPGFVQGASQTASKSLWIGAATLIVLAGLLVFVRVAAAPAILAIVVLASLELFIFARQHRPTFELEHTQFTALAAQLREQSEGVRVLNLLGGNSAMATRLSDVGGHDPGVLLRYAQFVFASQDQDPNAADQYFSFQHTPRPFERLYSMLRLRFAIVPQRDGRVGISAFNRPLPQAHLVYQASVYSDRDTVFAALNDPAFDPWKRVILEREPTPTRVLDPTTVGGYARVVEQDTDSLVIEAETPSPAILLITDNYAKGWRATPLEPSPQGEYEIIAANYTLRGIPLDAGRHKLLVRYEPRSFVIGRWITLASLAVYVLAIVAWWLRSRQSGSVASSVS